MVAVTEWVRHALFDLARAATELTQLRAHMSHTVRAAAELHGNFEQRRHVQLLHEAARAMDLHVTRALEACRLTTRALPVSGTDALGATRCLQLARDARRAIKRVETENDHARRILVDAQLECFRRLRLVSGEARVPITLELEALARRRRAQELGMMRKVERLAARFERKLTSSWTAGNATRRM